MLCGFLPAECELELSDDSHSKQQAFMLLSQTNASSVAWHAKHTMKENVSLRRIIYKMNYDRDRRTKNISGQIFVLRHSNNCPLFHKCTNGSAAQVLIVRFQSMCILNLRDANSVLWSNICRRCEICVLMYHAYCTFCNSVSLMYCKKFPDIDVIIVYEC